MAKNLFIGICLILAGLFATPGAVHAQITVFSECNFQGKAISLQPGIYDTKSLERAGVKDDSISSVVVSDGFSATLYTDDRFDGTVGALRKSSSCLKSNTFNDKVSSLTVQKRGNEKLAAEAVEKRYPKQSLVSGVTFYSLCDYRGNQATLAPGDYRLADLRDAGIANNDISSIKVPRGYQVVVYANDFLRGQSLALQDNDSCLRNDGLDQQISSLSISVDERYATNSNGGLLNQTGSLASNQPQTVVAYSECNFSGERVALEAGEYTVAQLNKLGMRNNMVSSIQVPRGFSVAIYENDFFRGNGKLLESDVRCLLGDHFNERISSIVVEGAAVGTTSGGSTGGSSSSSAVSVYSKCGYDGRRASLDVGEYNAAGLNLLGISDNTISSIKVNPGFQAELFFNDFLRGKSGYLRSDDNCLSNDGFDNEISSIRISRVTDNNNASNDLVSDATTAVATVYGQCDYLGGSVSLQPGRYTQNQLRELGISNDAIASLQVKPGFTVILYDNGQLRGRGTAFTRDDACLDDNNLLRRVSSLIIGKSARSSASTTTTASSASSAVLSQGLNCMSLYVERGICEARRWNAIRDRCKIDNIPQMSDGYLEKHVRAGNCTVEKWPELQSRVRDPMLR